MSSEGYGYQHLHEVAPGLLFGSVYRFHELKDCFLSECDCWVLKFEQLLIHASFLLGYISPRRLVWIIIRNQLNRFAIKVGGQLDLPSIQPEFEMGMSILEQIGLVHIWDALRDASICMRFNNCDNDFMAQISNIKIKVCNVEDEDSSNDMRKLTVCERVFNDSPLILLALGMLLLAVLAHSVVTSYDDTPTAANPSKSEDSSGTPSTSKDPSLLSSALPSGLARVASNVDFGTYGQEIFLSTNFPDYDDTLELQASVSTSTKPPCPHQDIQAKCPNCKKEFLLFVPKPWRLTCPHINVVKASGKKAQKNKREESGACSSKNNLSEEEVKELIKCLKCNHCKETLEKRLQAVLLKHKQRKAADDAEKKSSKNSSKTKKKVVSYQKGVSQLF